MYKDKATIPIGWQKNHTIHWYMAQQTLKSIPTDDCDTNT